MMHLTQPAVVETLNALRAELSSAQSPVTSLTRLAELLEEDVLGRTIVSYLQRHVEQAGSKLAYGDVANFVEALSQALQASPLDGTNLLAAVIAQAQVLEEKTGIYPSAADPFDNFSAQSADKLEELINNRRSGKDTATTQTNLEELISSYGMLRLLSYVNQLDSNNGDNYETVKTYLSQGQEYLIGKSDSLGELVESTLISATAADWGVEDFLVNPPSEPTVDPFGDQDLAAESRREQQAFDDLFANLTESSGQEEAAKAEQAFGDLCSSLVEEPAVAVESVEEAETIGQQAFDDLFSNLTEESSVSEEIEGGEEVSSKVESEQELADLLGTATEQGEISISLSEDGTEKAEESFDLSISLAQEELSLPERTQEAVEESIADLGIASMTEESAVTTEGGEEDLTDLTFDLGTAEESIADRGAGSTTEESTVMTEELDLSLGEVTAEQVEQSFAAAESTTEEFLLPRRVSLLELGLLELVREAIGDEDGAIDYAVILGEETDAVVATSAKEVVTVTEQLTVERGLDEDVTVLQDVPQFFTTVGEAESISSSDTADDLFGEIAELGEASIATETAEEAIATAETADDLFVTETAEAEEPIITTETRESTIDDLFDTAQVAEEPAIPGFEVDEDVTILQDVPQFFNLEQTITTDEPTVSSEAEESTIDDLFTTEQTAEEMSASSKAAEVWEEGAEENTETIEELLHDLVTEAESSPVTPEEAEIDDLLAEIEGQQAESVPSVDELLADIEQQAEAIDYPEDEDMTILQGTPEFFATVTAEPKLPEELVEEVSLDDMQGEDTEEEVVEEDMTTIQEMPEFFATLTAEEQEEEGFSIRAYDQQTDVVEFSELFDLEQASQEKEEVRDSDSGNDIEEELSQLLGEIEEQEIEEIASTFASDDEDESGFFFSQETIIDEEDSEGELTLLQLFNADNGEAPESEDPIDELAQLLGEEDRTTETAVAAEEVDAIDELSELLEETGTMAENNTTDVFAELESLLEEEVDISQLEELEALLEQPSPPPSNFDDLDALLSSIPPSPSKAAEVTSPGKGKTALNIAPAPGPSPRSTMVQNMRVDVRYLDNMNNLVGELIVNRNLLQQDQQRLQASLANLFNQINKLNDIAQKVRDEFDRSLMERRLEETLGHRYLKEERRSLIPSTDNKQQEQDHSTLIANDLDKHDKFNELALDIIELITRVKESASDVEFVIDETEQVSRQLGTITTQLEDDLKQVRMEPFSEISDRLPKQVRDLALKRKKQADIEISGRETMIDKVILQGLNTPINHLITNALVHGIEDPETRIALGKPPKGKITVKAYHQGNETIISVSDDGAGINPEKVRQSAITKGILTRAEAALLSDQDTYSLLFRPGFSTKAEVDEEGGRGVGLDAVVTQLNSIKGSIQVESAIGKGTTFTIRLPLTLSISKAIVCVCNRNRVAFPIDSFEDMVEITQDKVYKNAEGLPCFTWRDRELPFRPLQDLLCYNRQIGRVGFIKHTDDDIISIIVIRSERNFLALQVDKFEGEIEIVIKQIEGPAPKPPGIAGVTVLGDGRVMAICNVLELFGIAAGTITIPKYEQVQTDIADKDKSTTVLVVDDSVTMRKALVQTFEKAGYRVEEARNGKEAWDKLTSGLSCDLIFTDVEMPQMNGFQLLEKLQKDEQLRRIPVAMLTSQGKRVHIENAARLGAKAYFVKAYTDQEVLEGAKRLLRGQVAGKILEIMSS